MVEALNDMKVFVRIVLIAILGTFLFDLVFSHIILYQNMPAFLTYFLAIKFIPSILFMGGFYLLFRKFFNSTLAYFVGVPLGIAIFVVFVQTYYGIYCIPLANGGEQCMSILASFKGGYPIHFFDYTISFGIVSLVGLLFKNKV